MNLWWDRREENVLPGHCGEMEKALLTPGAGAAAGLPFALRGGQTLRDAAL